MSPDKAADLWAMQSQMLWSRIKTASVVEAGTVTAVYTLWNGYHKDPSFPIVLLFFSIALLICIIFLMRRDNLYMEMFRKMAGFEKPDGGGSGLAMGVLLIVALIGLNGTMMYLLLQ